MISIIIAVYNNEKYLPKAIESALNQNFSKFEIIIVDDGSTDNTGKIADEYAKNDSRIKVIHQKNQWIYASFNRGIKEACGEYIYILNSDDTLCSNVLNDMYNIIIEYKPDVIWTQVMTHECDSEQNIIRYDRGNVANRKIKDAFYDTQEKVRTAWPYFEKSSLAHNQANLYRRELIMNHPFRNDVYGADTLFNIDIAPYVKTAFVMGKTVYNHYIYDDESMNASVGKYYTYEHDMFNEIYNGYMSLFDSWELDKNDYEVFFSKRRMSQFTGVIRRLMHPKCEFTTDEKIELIFTKYIDETIKRCVAILSAEEELESRVLSGVREILLKESLENSDKMYFVYDLLESLLRYEKTDEDFIKLEKAISHPLNPSCIGKLFYEKLLKK